MENIPVIDFEGVSATSACSGCPQLEQLHKAFTEIGFVFLKNHGIAEREHVRVGYHFQLFVIGMQNS